MYISVCMPTASQTLFSLLNLVNKESEPDNYALRVDESDVNGRNMGLTPATMGMPSRKAARHTEARISVLFFPVLNVWGNWSVMEVITVSAAENYTHTHTRF